MVKKLGVVLLMFAWTVVLGGCSAPIASQPTSPPPASSARIVESPEQIAERLNLHLQGRGDIETATVPADLDAGPAWGLVQTVCQQGGYDLRPWSGHTVTMREYRVRERYEGLAQSLWIIESGHMIIGAYISVDELIPGVFGVGDPTHLQ